MCPFQLYVAQAGVHMTWENIKRLTQVLYPPKTKVMSDLMMQGFLDTTRFLRYALNTFLEKQTSLKRTFFYFAQRIRSYQPPTVMPHGRIPHADTAEKCNRGFTEGQSEDFYG